MADNTEDKPLTPNALMARRVLSSEVCLCWDKPKVGSSDVDHYEVKYRESNLKTPKWSQYLTSDPTNTISIGNLKAGVEFEFKVRAIDKAGDEGPFCVPSLKITTSSSIADSVKCKAIKLTGNQCSPLSVYKLPLEIPSSSIDMKNKTRKCIFGSRDATKPERTIMVVGATGAGKSTLIDGMINYIMDVSWDSDFRFSLVDLTAEENSKLKDQALSQTEWITCYEIAAVHGSKIDFNLNIIDTPGFGDTRGIVRDKAITDQIREFFKNPGKQGVSSLNAVCFVTQAPLARLTHTQKYVFDSILSIFGSDIANNIYVLMTFADGNNPPVLKALEGAKVPFQCSFKFNSSALFVDNKCKKDDFGSMFWKMGTDSFCFFFNELKKLEPKSLSMTTEVLKIRQSLEATIQGLQPQITEGMHQLDTIRQEKKILDEHKADIDARRNFVEYVDVLKMKKVDLDPGDHVTNCSHCNKTCHPSCIYGDDADKKWCGVMSNEYCTVCPQKCHWTRHQNNAFRFECYTVKEPRTLEDLKRKFFSASANADKQSTMVEKAKGAFNMLGKKVMNMIKEVRQYINKLDEIALRKNPLSDIDYINILIESEKSDAKPGWQDRLTLLNKLKAEAEIIVKSTEENFNPWGSDEGVLRD